MSSEPCNLERFSSLPAEVRLHIWRSTLEGDLVAILPNQDHLVYRRRNPVISRVNRESRWEFLRLNLRVGAKSDVNSPNSAEYVYLNPRIDTLVLGSIIALTPREEFGMVKKIWAPSMSNADAELIREVRLHEPNLWLQAPLAAGVWFRLHISFDLEEWLLDHGDRDVPRLPRLQFPNLDTIWIASLYEGEGNSGSVRNRGTVYHYVIPTGEVFVSSITDADFDEGMRTFRPGVDASKVAVVRVNLLRTREPDWEVKGWKAVLENGKPNTGNPGWLIVNRYIIRRLVE
ncbi:uncharacterized protein CTRU02_207526 [Colletotrichum truncatum]|uniref:Uncharacterized protein n=1 Tax=Colletotrichum truncatum TaxID=5467 RepID=A0ACC3Z132_COLTU|nr:uncharacterized protein CTRU02_00844 [Colletotrichum truncatum]KAF6800439.1 hypothetical protein CTRU02_00844 [Colletotrichum truncatum]